MKKILELFRKPSAFTIAQRDMEEAQRQGLSHRAAAEFHAKNSEYYDGLVKRLKAYLKDVS